MFRNNNPGRPRWWFELAVYRLTGYCKHQDGWVKAEEDCNIAWDVEYDVVRNPQDWYEDA